VSSLVSPVALWFTCSADIVIEWMLIDHYTDLETSGFATLEADGIDNRRLKKAIWDSLISPNLLETRPSNPQHLLLVANRKPDENYADSTIQQRQSFMLESSISTDQGNDVKSHVGFH
jgi:hypothetical protein